MFNMKILRILKEQCDETDFEKNLKPNASAEARLRNKQQNFDELKMRLWYEIIQSLHRCSAMFLGPYKEEGPMAWAVMCDRYKSCERPRLQQLIEKFTNLKMILNESVIEYITRAEELQCNLREVDEKVNEPMLISIILKGVTDDFDNFATICKLSKDMNKIWIVLNEIEWILITTKDNVAMMSVGGLLSFAVIDRKLNWNVIFVGK